VNVEESFDHMAVGAMEDPYPLVNDLRSRCPVAHSNAHGGFWSVMRNADARRVANDPQLFSSAGGASIPHHNFPYAVPPIEIDPPDHIQYRAPLIERFSRRTVARMEDAVRATVTELIDNFIAEGQVEFVSALCFPLPTITVANLLGLPEEDHENFKAWAKQVFQVDDNLGAVMELIQYFYGIYEERQENPRDPAYDIPSLLHTMRVNDEPLSPEDFLMLLTEIVTAGLDSTANAANHMLLILSQRRDLRDQLIADPSLIPAAVDEMLRFISPLPASARTTTSACTVGDVELAEDVKIAVNWLAANHDPEGFPDPEEIQFDRSPNRHLAFGYGPHRCLGSNLALLEIRVMLEEVLRRLPDYTIDEEGVVRYVSMIRAISHLPATFTPSSVGT
jgi:cytochrome P450